MIRGREERGLEITKAFSPSYRLYELEATRHFRKGI
jgi:hypothetical protein